MGLGGFQDTYENMTAHLFEGVVTKAHTTLLQQYSHTFPAAQEEEFSDPSQFLKKPTIQ